MCSAVKLEGVTDVSTIPCLERAANSLSPPGEAAGKERAAQEPGGLRVMGESGLVILANLAGGGWVWCGDPGRRNNAHHKSMAVTRGIH